MKAQTKKVVDVKKLAANDVAVEEFDVIKNAEGVKQHDKSATKEVKEPKAPKAQTKKSIVIEMISTKKGALVADIAKAIVDKGIDPDLEKNVRVVKLWLAKIGFKVERLEGGLYRKA